MTFVTEGNNGRNSSIRGINEEGNRGTRIEIYSGESISASNAFRLEIVTVRPSI
jgi:hypothetical protein